MNKAAFKKLTALFCRDRKRTFSMLAFLILSSILVSVAPHTLGNVTNIVTDGVAAGGIDWRAFALWCTILLGIYLGQFLTKWIAGWISARIASDVAKQLRGEVEKKLWKLPLNYYDTKKRGDLMSVITNDIDNVVTTLNQTGGDLVYYVLMLLGMIIMMLVISWQLALVTMILVPISGRVIKKVTKLSAPKYRKQWQYTGAINARVEESFNGYNVLKAYGREKEFEEAFQKQNQALYKAMLHATVISNMISPISRFLTNINYVIVALAGALKIIAGSMTLGGVLAFIQYSRQFQQPFTQISHMIATMQSGLASLERIDALLENEEEDEDPAYAPFEFKGQVDFRDVCFRYVPDRKLIENMNLSVKPGQMVAIVGGTGAGKTTLVNLIERFYEINSGSILLDGDTPIRSISRRALRENIAMVLQDTWLYRGTIRENILYALPENRKISEEQFLEACRLTFVDDFVRSLPNGYDTIVDNESTAVSAGEKQLITIARAFLKGANTLILDEATSSVDTRTEALIQKALDRLRQGRTSFVIAHRLSTIRNADIILVMEKGRIVEQGTHAQLLAKGGVYTRLYQAQFEH